MELKRHQDWPTKLSNFLFSRANTPFEYGKNDCCLFVADAVLAMTGHDFAEKHFRGKYSSEVSAARVLRKFSGGGVVEMMQKFTQRGYFEEINPPYAGRGDVVSLDLKGVTSLGIVDLSGKHIASVGLEGMVSIPIALIMRGWKLWQQ